MTACLTEVVAWLTSAKISYTGVHTQLQVNNEVLQYLRHNYIIVVTWVKVTIFNNKILVHADYKDMPCF